MLVAVVWGLFVAPKATFALPKAAKAFLGFVVLEIAAAALFAAGQAVLAVVFAVLIAVNAALMLLWGQ